LAAGGLDLPVGFRAEHAFEFGAPFDLALPARVGVGGVADLHERVAQHTQPDARLTAVDERHVAVLVELLVIVRPAFTRRVDAFRPHGTLVVVHAPVEIGGGQSGRLIHAGLEIVLSARRVRAAGWFSRLRAHHRILSWMGSRRGYAPVSVGHLWDMNETSNAS